MSAWPTVALGEVCHVEIGRTPARAERAYWTDGTEPWVSIADISASRVAGRTKEVITDRAVRECGCKQIASNTVLMSFKLSLGKVAITDRPVYTNEAVAALPIRNDKILDTQYLARALEAHDFTEVGDRAAKGRTLNKRSVALLPILLPPLAEQRRIAVVLNKADALCRRRRDALALLDGLAGAIFVEMFGGDERSPGNWPVRPFGDLIQDALIGLVRGAEEIRPDGPVPYLKMDAIGTDGRITMSKIVATDASEREVSRFQLARGDLLFNTRNTRELVGKSAVYYGPSGVVYNNNIMRVRLKNAAPDFVSAYLRSRFGSSELERRKSGTTSVFAVYAKSLAVLPVPVPPASIQSAFSARCASVRQSRDALAHSLAYLDTLFSSLQSRAFAGEL